MLFPINWLPVEPATGGHSIACDLQQEFRPWIRKLKKEKPLRLAPERLTRMPEQSTTNSPKIMPDLNKHESGREAQNDPAPADTPDSDIDADTVDFKPWEATDAGFGDEFKAAEGESRKATLRLADDAATGEVAVRQARQDPDLVKRAKALHRLNAFGLPEEKPVNSGGMVVMQPLVSDLNFWAVYDALFGSELPSRPHFDTFSGTPKDHNGKTLDDRTPIMEMTKAVKAANLTGIRAADVRRTYRDWILDKRMNDLEHRFNTRIPDWDGEFRLETLLIDLFKPFDTPLNRAFGRYFWLSVYCRVTYPGCFAPMVLSLFGAQNAGKSWMSTLICREATGDRNANSVLLNLGKDRNSFLRAMTGNSIIANIGEMTGFSKGDLNDIKDFITRTSDMMDQKYEKHINQARQWVCVMDGNKYEGLQRDDTGNRRFYPMFVGQLTDENGQPRWDPSFKVDYTGFADKFWQAMAECRAWLDENGGLDGYDDFVREVIEMVKEFNDNERRMDRGTVHDPELDNAFLPGLLACEMRYISRRAKNKGRKGVLVDFNELLGNVTKLFTTTKAPHNNHIEPKLSALGGEPCTINSHPCYFFECESVEAFIDRLHGGSEEVDEISVHNKRDENGGF